MSIKIRNWIDKWDKVVVMASLALSLIIFLKSSANSSGRQEQSLIDIKAKQGEQDKSLSEFKVDVEYKQEKQDNFNAGVTSALNKIINNANLTTAYLRALSVDHKKLMLLHPKIYPENPIDFNLNQEKITLPKEDAQVSNGKMKPFSQ